MDQENRVSAVSAWPAILRPRLRGDGVPRCRPACGDGCKVQTGRPERLVGVLVRHAEGVTNPGVEMADLPPDVCKSVLAAGVASDTAPSQAAYMDLT
jgi:hypothetical protein